MLHSWGGLTTVSILEVLRRDRQNYLINEIFDRLGLECHPEAKRIQVDKQP